MNTQKPQFGVSLVELMIVVGLVAILAAWAGPAWRSAITRDAIATSTNRFLLAISDARDAAQDTATGASLVASAPAADDEWGEGWTLIDADPAVAAPNNLIEDYGRLPATITINARNNADTRLDFGTNGIRNAAADSIFEVCDQSVVGEFGREITVSVLGRAEISNRVFPCP